MAKSSKTNFLNIAKRIAAMMLVFVLIVLVGCNRGNTSSSDDPGSSKPGQNVSSDGNGNTEDTQSGQDSSSEDSQTDVDSDTNEDSDDAENSGNTNDSDDDKDSESNDDSEDDKDSESNDDSEDDKDSEDTDDSEDDKDSEDTDDKENSENSGSTPSINIDPLEGNVSVGMQIDSMPVELDEITRKIMQLEIEGDEKVPYGDSSTKDKIVIEAKEDISEKVGNYGGE